MARTEDPNRQPEGTGVNAPGVEDLDEAATDGPHVDDDPATRALAAAPRLDDVSATPPE